LADRVVTAPAVWLTAGASLLLASLAGYGWRRRDQPGGRWFAVLTLASAVWAGVYAAGLAVPAGETALRVTLERLMFVGVAAVPVGWLAFGATYAGYWTDRRRTRRRVAALSVVPLVTLVGALTNPAHGLFLSTPRVVRGTVLGGGVSTVVYGYGPLFALLTVYGFALVGVGTLLLLRAAVTADGLYVEQVASLAVGASVAAVANGLSVTGFVPVDGMDVTPLGLAVTGVAFANALARHRLLDRTPATRRLGRAAVVENVHEGVVVVDADGEVTDVNPVVESLLDTDRTALVGTPVTEAPAPVFESATTGEPASAAAVDGATVRVGDDWFDVQVASLSNRADRAAGHVLTLRDVTDRRAREQRLAVMNRLLRHNFRNEITVVHGFAELLDERLDGDDGELAGRLHEVATELVDRVQKAGGVERVARLTDADPDAVDLRRLAEGVAAEVTAAYPDSTVRVEAPDEPVLARIAVENAETTVRNLLENAVEHTDDTSPTATVSVGHDGDRVELAVADDGPGIPPDERAVFETGRETDLEHGSGLGLWLVHWGVQAADGEVQFETDDSRGTVVRVSLPAADPGAAEVVRPSDESPVDAATAETTDEGGVDPASLADPQD
jgi:PAS domain S-box-containing protein